MIMTSDKREWKVYRLENNGEEIYMCVMKLIEWEDADVIVRKRIWTNQSPTGRPAKRVSIDWDNNQGYVIDDSGKDIFKLVRVEK